MTVDELLTLPKAEQLRLLMAKHAETLAAKEAAKSHFFHTFRLSDKEWADFKAHMLDGGGLDDDADLALKVANAFYNDDQDTFWSELPHLIKAGWKRRGQFQQVPGGGTIMNGVGPSVVPVLTRSK